MTAVDRTNYGIEAESRVQAMAPAHDIRDDYVPRHSGTTVTGQLLAMQRDSLVKAKVADSPVVLYVGKHVPRQARLGRIVELYRAGHHPRAIIDAQVRAS